MSAHLHPVALLRPLSRPARPWGQALMLMLRAFRTRQALDELDDHILRDIGVTRLEARLESRRAPWDH
ncbi:DUF1127 domain-containing protein [Sabulicella rubraurantiaca]|uniref:DUF1127 domain-containing protein n=1 Tax=Sabulicella rubraurantiaca TaxID=2811429 RepID=UPI001A9707BA|nr:DUF1127 domain-containing protein [Sabulicella rubraurantiaca]